METARGSRRVALAALAWLVFSGPLWAACDPARANLRGDWGQASFAVSVMDDAAERAQGLMFVEKMPAMEGMLFVYARPQPVSFWMRNTLIPLDMLFLDDSGTVQRIHRNAVPLDETAIPGGDDILAVLEINGGMSDRLGIAEGSVLRHPDLPQARAAWPCE